MKDSKLQIIKENKYFGEGARDYMYETELKLVKLDFATGFQDFKIVILGMF